MAMRRDARVTSWSFKHCENHDHATFMRTSAQASAGWNFNQGWDPRSKIQDCPEVCWQNLGSRLKPIEPIEISIGDGIQDPRLSRGLLAESWIPIETDWTDWNFNRDQDPRSKIQDSQGRPLSNLGSWIRAPIEISIGLIGFNRHTDVGSVWMCLDNLTVYACMCAWMIMWTCWWIGRVEKNGHVEMVGSGKSWAILDPESNMIPKWFGWFRADSPSQDLPNSMSVIALILVDLWGRVPHICICIYIYIYIFIYLFIYLSIYLSSYVFMYLFVYLCVHMHWYIPNIYPKEISGIIPILVLVLRAPLRAHTVASEVEGQASEGSFQRLRSHFPGSMLVSQISDPDSLSCLRRCKVNTTLEPEPTQAPRARESRIFDAKCRLTSLGRRLKFQLIVSSSW